MIPRCNKCGALATGIQSSYPQGFKCGGTLTTDSYGKTDFQRHSFGNLRSLTPEIAKAMGWDDYEGLLERAGITQQSSSSVWANLT